MSMHSMPRPSRRSKRPPLGSQGTLQAADAHDGWRDFLEEEGSTVDPRLCHLLAKFGRPLRRAAKETDAAEDKGRELAGFPWVTPVVGSGCLSQPDDSQQQLLLALPGELASALHVSSESLDSLDVATLVREFSRSLLEQRVRELAGQPFPVRAEQLPLSDDVVIAAHCVLAAALVHRAWHEGVAMSNSIVRPRDELRLTGDEIRREEITMGLLAPAAGALHKTIEKLKQAPESPLATTRMVVERLAARIDNHVNGESPRLSGHDVDGLVEVAWLMLITPVGLYPGWRDLMTATALQSSLHRQAAPGDRSMDFSRPRPPIRDVHEAGQLAASVASLKVATNRSWADRIGDQDRPDSPRIEFYDGLADLLIAEACYGYDESLVPAAFVTSMDLELEMSLVRRLSALAARDEKFDARFTVLVPYHFLYGPSDEDPRAMLFWLAASMDVRSLELGNTFDLTNADIRWRDAQDTLTRSNEGIVVVRLVGSPLMPIATAETPLRELRSGRPFRGETVGKRLRSLAAAASGSDNETFDRAYNEQKILPAFMLDEYSGLHQMAAVAQGGLSSNLVNLEPDWIFRYWLSVGVQLDDVLVRLLLASHVDTSSGRRALLEHHGVMVNRFVSKAEVDLLAWQGFDAVQSRFDHVTPDLRHYAAHMRYRAESPHARDPENTFEADGYCPLTGDPA